MFGTIEDQLAVDEDVFDAIAIVEWVFVGGLIDHALGIGDGNVGELALTQQAPIMDTYPGGK